MKLELAEEDLGELFSTFAWNKNNEKRPHCICSVINKISLKT